MSLLTYGSCILSGCALAYWATSACTTVAVAVLAPGIACVVWAVALLPANGSVHYVGNARGLYFPTRRRSWILGRSKTQPWLFVPWSNVLRISVAPLLDESGRKGVSFSLRVSDEQRRLYFPRAAVLDWGDESRINTACSILVAYPSICKPLHKIVSILCALQRQPEEDNARADLAMLGVR